MGWISGFGFVCGFGVNSVGTSCMVLRCFGVVLECGCGLCILLLMCVA